MVAFSVHSMVYWQDVKPTIPGVLVNLKKKKKMSPISAPVCMPHGVNAHGHLTTLFFSQEFLLPRTCSLISISQRKSRPLQRPWLPIGQPDLNDSASLMEINAHADVCSVSTICNLLHQGKERKGGWIERGGLPIKYPPYIPVSYQSSDLCLYVFSCLLWLL